MDTPTPFLVPSGLNEENYLDWLFSLNNETCKLPCWWGIEPESTNFSTLDPVMAPLGLRELGHRESMPDGIIPSGFSNSNNSFGNVSGVFWFWEQVYQGIKVVLEPSSSTGGGLSFIQTHYELKPILIEYGMPSRVLVGLIADAPEPTTTWVYEIWVFYDDKGMGLNCRGPYDLPTSTDHAIRVCLNRLDLIFLYLQSPNGLRDFVEYQFGEELGIEYLLEHQFLRPWEEVTGLSVAEFYSMFSRDNNDCFDSPRELWQ